MVPLLLPAMPPMTQSVWLVYKVPSATLLLTVPPFSLTIMPMLMLAVVEPK